MNDTQPPTPVVQSGQKAQSPDRSATLDSHFPSGAANPLAVFMADIQVIRESDPAARNLLEVLLCYPGLHALWNHRIAHWLHSIHIPFLPRFLSSLSRWFTGIEIHPGAVIGKGVFIDHGMGVVIGETAIVGDYCLIYQGVTLGGTGKETGKRHPTLGQHVVVGAGAKILGNISIGDHVRIGAGSVVLRNVPSDCTVVGVPGRITRRNGVKNDDLEHNDLRDMEAEVLRAFFDRLKELEQQVEQLQAQRSFSLVQTSQNQQESTETDQMIEEFLHGAGI
jgi:serine O-acetyltransferase